MYVVPAGSGRLYNIQGNVVQQTVQYKVAVSDVCCASRQEKTVQHTGECCTVDSTVHGGCE